MVIRYSFSPSIILTNNKKRTSDTDETDVKKSKIEATTDSNFKKPLPKRTALEEVREVILASCFYIQI